MEIVLEGSITLKRPCFLEWGIHAVHRSHKEDLGNTGACFNGVRMSMTGKASMGMRRRTNRPRYMGVIRASSGMHLHVCRATTRPPIM